MNEQLLNKRKRWYSSQTVKYQLVDSMRDREVILMDRKDNWKTIRGIFIKTTWYLDHVYNLYNFFEKDYNIYISVGKYREIPDFTPKLKDRSGYTSEWFEKESFKQLYEYDMLLDFDMDNISNFIKMKNEVSKMVKILLGEKICFYFYPSGNNFQIIIPSENFDFERYFSPNFEDKTSFNRKILDITKNLKTRFALKYLDLKGIGVHNKITKCPYSLVKDKTVLPFASDIMGVIYVFDNLFTYKDIDCNNVFSTTNLLRRGLCKINNINTQKNKDNMNKFLNKYFLLEDYNEKKNK